jgi:hypothetical protein
LDTDGTIRVADKDDLDYEYLLKHGGNCIVLNIQVADGGFTDAALVSIDIKQHLSDLISIEHIKRSRQISASFYYLQLIYSRIK